MKTIFILSAILFIDVVHGFSSVPDGDNPDPRANAVELARSPCQDIFFGKGTRRTNPLKPEQAAAITICGQIESGVLNKHVRFARQNNGNAEWCNAGGRIGSPNECAQAYALVGSKFTPCEYEVATGKCVLSTTQSQQTCRETPEVCSILREAKAAGSSDVVTIPNTQEFNPLCAELKTKTTCNKRVFTFTGIASTREQFASCTWTGSRCTGLGPHVCPVVARRELEGEEASESEDLEQEHARQLQAANPCAAAFSTQAACDNGYTYASGVAYDYASYSNTNRPPQLAICEWRAGSCQQVRTCPYMCELAADRNIDVPGTIDTDVTLTFGDRALDMFCEADIERKNRASVCENHYRAEKTNSGIAPRIITACRHGVADSGPFCTREIRAGFSACL